MLDKLVQKFLIILQYFSRFFSPLRNYIVRVETFNYSFHFASTPTLPLQRIAFSHDNIIFDIGYVHLLSTFTLYDFYTLSEVSFSDLIREMQN